MASEMTPEELATSGIFGKQSDSNPIEARDWVDAVHRQVEILSEDILQTLFKRSSQFKELGQLPQTIGAPLPVNKNGVLTFTVTMADYGTYLDEGVKGFNHTYRGIRHNRQGFQRGKKPPLGELQKRYGIGEAARAQAIIFYRGIKPRHFFSDTWTIQRQQELTDSIAEVTKDQILGAIRKTVR